MKREDWQKAYAPQGDGLNIRVRNVLSALREEPERPMRMKRAFAIVLVTVMAFVSVAALAAGLIFSGRADAVQLADRALEERYGITTAMQTYFRRDIQEAEDGHTVITYTGIEDFAYVLGTYTVIVQAGGAEAVWSRDGESTEGGLEAKAWGARQLQYALDVNSETHSFGEISQKALEHAQAANEEPQTEPAHMDELLPPEGYQSWPHYYKTQALPIMAIAPKDALELAKNAIVEQYGLSQAQADKLEWHDTWTDFGMVGEIPVLDVWFWLWMEEGGLWSEGDGLYGAAVNVETGVIEETYYDSGLAGNG